MIKVGILGATGYGGVELLRLLSNHPQVEITALGSVSFEGKQLSEIYPAFSGIIEKTLEAEDSVIEKCDVIFGALPHGLSEAIAKKCVDNNKKYIDLGADFRLDSEEQYKEWYGLDYTQKKLHKYSVYSIPEISRKSVKSAKIVANPGCYPTSVVLGLAPVLKQDFADLSSIIIDSKSGVTGAGRGLSQTTHFPDCNEAFSAYKICQHRHTPEIEQALSKISGTDIKVTFVPHLLPINRGILSTIYLNLTKQITLDSLHNIYSSFYQNEQFVRVLPLGESPNLKNVKHSNYCHISIHKDNRTNRLVVVSVIDNMVKGAAGQAIQNMNIIFDIPENSGLNLTPTSF